jgi:hypothetical protein
VIAVLWTAVVLTATVALASLALGLQLARRYRELHRAMTESRAWASAEPPLPAEGAPVREFRATTTEGVLVTAADLHGEDTLVAVLMAGCAPCAEALPGLRRLFARTPADAPRPLVILAGAGDDKASYLDQLGPVARVIVEDLGGPTAEALDVHSYPTFLIVGAGMVRRATSRLDGVDTAVPA